MDFTTFKELDLDLIKTMASGLKEEAKKNFEEQYYLIYQKLHEQDRKFYH